MLNKIRWVCGINLTILYLNNRIRTFIHQLLFRLKKLSFVAYLILSFLKIFILIEGFASENINE